MKEFIKKIASATNLKKRDWLFIIGGLLVFAVVTLYTISKSSIWFDEAFGAYMIHFNFAEIARYTATDVHPPLFYWFLKIWSMIFGNTEIGLRSMSAVFGGISIILGYLLTSRLFNKKVARISLIFLALSPMLVRYSQEARMYTMVAAIAIAATYVLTFAVNTKKRLPWVIYGILVGLGMWTNYFSMLVWLSHWIWRAGFVRRLAGKGKFLRTFFSRQWIMAHIIAIAIFIPWVPSLVRQVLNVQINGFWIPPVNPGTPINFLNTVMFYQETDKVNGWLALAAILAIAVVAILAIRIYKKMNLASRQSYQLIMAISFVPVILLFLLSMPPLRSSFVDRYLMTSILGISLFIGVTLALGFDALHRKKQIIVTIFMAALMVIGVTNVWYYGNYNKTSNMSNNTRQILDEVVKNSANGQPIIAASPWIFYEAVFYSTDNHPVYFIDADTSYQISSLDMLHYSNQHKILDVAQFSRINPIVWYVGRPDDNKFSAPYPNWRPIKELSYGDPITGKSGFKAIQYQIIQRY